MKIRTVVFTLVTLLVLTSSGIGFTLAGSAAPLGAGPAGRLPLAQVNAGAPAYFNYQGLLLDDSGKPVADGDYQLTFAIYDVASGGSALWSEAQTVTVVKGLFNVVLG